MITHLLPVIPVRDHVANLEADHKEDDKEDEQAGEDDVAGEGERVRGNQLAADVLDTGVNIWQ